MLVLLLLGALGHVDQLVVLGVLVAGVLGGHPERRHRRHEPLRQIGHLVEPQPVRERLVGVQVVRLPEGAAVGRDRDAARARPCCGSPTGPWRRPRGPGSRPRRPSRRRARATKTREDHGKGEQPRVGEDRHARDDARARRRATPTGGRSSAASARTSPRRAAGRGSRGSRGCRARRGRAGASRSPRRSGRSARSGTAFRSRRRRSRCRRRPGSAPSRPTTSGSRRSRRSGSGTSRRAAGCRPTDGPGRSRRCRRGDRAARGCCDFSKLLRIEARSCTSTTIRGSAQTAITIG